MPGNILWQSGSVLSFAMQASGQGNQLTNGSQVQLTNNLVNNGASGGPCLFGNFEMVCAASGFGAAVTNQASVDLYLVPSLDGTNFMTASTSGLPTNNYAGSFVSPVSGNVSRLRMGVTALPVLPIQYQGWIYNNTGQTLTSGWSLFFTGNNEAWTG